MSVKHLVVGWASSVYANACGPLLCLLVPKLFMQHDRRWKYVSICWNVHRVAFIA